ncbi:MAG: S9 family peptidase [Candidatus Zixiibacteriota bacterium]
MPRRASRIRKKRGILAEDLFKLRIPTSIALSPDEKKIAYTVERMDKKENKYFANLFVYDIAARQERQFTHGDNHDSQPVWSPDGNRIAFLSKRDKKLGIYFIPAGGGAEKQVIELDGSVQSLQWTPDGKHLLFSLRYNDSHYIKDEKKKKEPPVYRHITRLWYRLDGEGYLPRDRFQVYSLEVDSGKLRQITKGKRDNLYPCISPNGQWIAYVSNRAPEPDLDYLREDLFIIPFKGGKEKRIPTPAGPVAAPTFSPDSATIAYLGHDKPEDPWGITNYHVWTVGLNGRPKAKDLMPGFDRMAMDLSITDTSDVHDYSPIFWSADGKRIFFLSSDTGATNLYYIPATAGKPTRIFKGKCHIKGFSVNGKTKTAALIYADLDNPGDIFTCPTAYGGENKAVRHTDLNKFLRTEVQLGKTQDVMFKSFDGTEVQGWLVVPPNFNPRRKYPAILEIHGGPTVQYAYTFMHEMQYLAAKGYLVIYTNPRGGAGRGETWAAAIAGGWGDLDFKDCMAAADYLEKQSFINPKKMGVTGGSYGGYMTNWIIGHTNRFAAAVTQRSVVDLKSFVGSSDFGFSLKREFDGWPWTNPENYERCSPITYFKNVGTPVLIIHSEKDLRCNIEQAEQMFVKLKVLRKKVEMVRFPDEPHGLSRHGRPDRRIARLEWIAKWFDRYLK